MLKVQKLKFGYHNIEAQDQKGSNVEIWWS